MQRTVTEDQGVIIADAVTALDLPPPVYGVVPDYWERADGSVVPRFELEIWADDAVQLTDAELFGAAPHTFEIADVTVTANATTNALAAVAHGLLTGDGSLVITGADVPLPLVATVASELDLGDVTTHVDTIIRAKEPALGAAGDDITVAITTGAPTAAGVLTEDLVARTVTLQIKTTATATIVSQLETLIGTSALIEVKTTGTGATTLTAGDALAATHLDGGVDGDEYFAIFVDSGHVKLAATLLEALSGTAIDLLDAGSGTIKLADNGDDGGAGETKRIRWHSFGLLGPAGDGVIDLDVQRAYLARHDHSPRAAAYALKATFGSAVAVTAQIFPQVDF